MRPEIATLFSEIDSAWPLFAMNRKRRPSTSIRKVAASGRSLNKYFTFGEVILARDHAVVKHPESLSFVEAASVWMTFMTAYDALVADARMKAGDLVIIPAAAKRPNG